MSIASHSLGDAPVGAQAPVSTGLLKPPKRRLAVAKADAVTEPEAR